MTLVAISYNPPQTPESKWKKGFAMFSKWHITPAKKRRFSCSSPTTAAAATEKVLRQRVSPSVKCEDLTAREFAQMAGIKINLTTDSEETDSAYEEPLGTSQMTSLTSRTAFSSESRARACRRIWDSDFWQCDEATANCSISSSSNQDTLFLAKLRSKPSQQNLTVPNVIQKGRFKIVVGQDDTEPVIHQQVVLEWKRKKSDPSTKN